MTPPAGFAAFRERVHADPALQARLAEAQAPDTFAALVVAEAAAAGLAVSAAEVAEAMRDGHLAFLMSHCEVV